MVQVTLTLDSNSIGLIFVRTEIALEDGKKVYFMERNMLSNIYNQLPKEHKGKVQVIFPRVMDLLNEVVSV